jgi:hypothetical protein
VITQTASSGESCPQAPRLAQLGAIKINKREYQEKLNQENDELVALNPELAQGFYDHLGNKLPKEKMEQFAYKPMGFINSGINDKLLESDLKIYDYLASRCNKHRNTRATNLEIQRARGYSNTTVKESLRRLRWYHLIRSKPYYVGPKRKRRVIYLLKWGTAYPDLCRENKIKAVNKNDVIFVSDYRPKEVLK